MPLHNESPTRADEPRHEESRRGHRPDQRRHRRPRGWGGTVAALSGTAAVAGLVAGTIVLMGPPDPDEVAAASTPTPAAKLDRATPSLTASPSLSASPSASPVPSASPSSGTASKPTRSRDSLIRSSPPAAPAPAKTTSSKPASPKGGPVGPDPTIPGPRSASQSTSDAEAMSLRLLNAERATVGLPPLTLRADLSDFARTWARHMRTSGFGHSSSSDTQYLVTGGRTWIGENIVWWSDESMTAQEAAEKFQAMWRHSPGHYKGQTSTSFTEVGVGIYHDDSGWWGVHNFSDAH
ncbi:CAP domain-containing protein [Streptomyces sp. HNM0645]|uniref:CAP domain-containing protein n=1 Tax=Streptomyces sp. HNM0645 TaxID=2782343 RepID=UPI0024B6F0D7|nr:CAP domain-containing protein [Streptomyces sp. HNM0645]MDI9887595.1 CAP domain-containing protein [Streptomyces sp. HNM0645]